MQSLLSLSIRTVRRAGVLAVLAPAALLAQKDDANFTWEGKVPTGRWMIIRNINGAVRVEGTSASGKVEVTGVKRWRRGDPDDVRFEVTRVGPNKDDVLVCAIWYDGTCDEHGQHNDNHGRHRNNDVSVEFTVKLPAGVKVDAETVNGSVRIDDVSAQVEAQTVNGSVDITTSTGPVNAETVNGDINARMDQIPKDANDLRFETVNGSIYIELPQQFDADVDMQTVNGSLRSDFALTLGGRVNPRHIRATIGNGGRRLRLETVNGGITLRKR